MFATKSFASSVHTQLRCIESLEEAIQVLNAEYEAVEKVKGEVAALKMKKLDDTKKQQSVS